MNSAFCLAVHALVYLHHRGELVSSEELARKSAPIRLGCARCWRA